MYYKTSFNAFDKKYEFILNTDELDCNEYDFAYWYVERDGHVFEVNINKTDFDTFDDDGFVVIFEDNEACEKAIYDDSVCIVFKMATRIDRAVAFLRQNISSRDIQDEWEWIEQDRCPLSYKMRDKIIDLMDEFTTDNELKEDWWQELYDEQDIFEML